MKGHQATIKDIAKALGISPSTVSRALKDHPDISPKTKDKVKKLAAQLQYRPNAIALSLKHSKSFTIGLIIPEIVHHFFSSIISGVSDVAYSSGYKVMITQSNESYEREVADAQALMASRVDGVLISVSKESTNYDHLRNLEKNGIPIVFFDRAVESISTDKVVVDDVNGAFQAVTHLLEQGCKKILHLTAPDHLLITKNRLEGYKRALSRAGVPFDENLIVQCDTYNGAIIRLEKLIKNKELDIDGVFAVNDATAIGAMRGIKNAGLKVPQDIKVVGFTNGLISLMTEPQLTTIEQHGFEMGQIAARILLSRIDNQDEFYIPETRVLKTELIIRESSTTLEI
jgi:LacI family transcriptional regulator